MPLIGVNIAVLDHDRVLLTRREDFEVWCLPGGHVDAGESVAQAAIREAKEETGLDVALDRLVGVYSTPRWAGGGAHIIAFAAHVVGGELVRQPEEVLDLRWFSVDELPEPLMWPHRQRILDALAGHQAALAWNQDLVWPGAPSDSQQSLYSLRDASGLSRQGFYAKYMPGPGESGEVCEVGPDSPAVDGD